MTISEARAYFGLKDTDPICEEGIMSILRSNQEQLNVWSLGTTDKQACEKEIEACKALLKGVQK